MKVLRRYLVLAKRMGGISQKQLGTRKGNGVSKLPGIASGGFGFSSIDQELQKALRGGGEILCQKRPFNRCHEIVQASQVSSKQLECVSPSE